jgi:hypothetical protein
MPEPHPALVASMCESEIKRDPIDDFDSASPVVLVPIPDPWPCRDTTVEFQTLMSSMREIARSYDGPVPTPELYIGSITSICESEIKRDPIHDFDCPLDDSDDILVPIPDTQTFTRESPVGFHHHRPSIPARGLGWREAPPYDLVPLSLIIRHGSFMRHLVIWPSWCSVAEGTLGADPRKCLCIGLCRQCSK